MRGYFRLANRQPAYLERRCGWESVREGNIVNIKHGKYLQYTTIDPNAGYEDVPSNYLTVTIELSQEGKQTVLSDSQGDFAGVTNGEKRYNDSVGSWDYALKGLKELVEKTNLSP